MVAIVLLGDVVPSTVNGTLPSPYFVDNFGTGTPPSKKMLTFYIFDTNTDL